MEQKLKLSPPWDGHMAMLASFFRGDDRVTVGCCVDGVATVEVHDQRMFDALSQVLRTQMRFGNVRLRIALKLGKDVKHSRTGTRLEMTDLAALKEVLKGNPAFARVQTRKTPTGTFVFVLFKPVVLQWYNDNIGSPWKLTTSTFELASHAVFRDGLGVSFATAPLSRGEKEDLTSITVCASKASGQWNVTGVAVKPVVEGKPFGRLLKTVKDFLDKNIDIVVGDGPKKKAK